ncbi:MAG: acylphosphatase [Lysobacterales bacterium]
MKTEREAKTTFHQKEEELPKRECRLFLIEGRVQGVLFRESTRREVQPLGITGYAKNMEDGSVQILACGEPAALNRLAEWLKQGPPMARVDRLEWIVSSSNCPESFVTL